MDAESVASDASNVGGSAPNGNRKTFLGLFRLSEHPDVKKTNRTHPRNLDRDVMQRDIFNRTFDSRSITEILSLTLMDILFLTPEGPVNSKIEKFREPKQELLLYFS